MSCNCQNYFLKYWHEQGFSHVWILSFLAHAIFPPWICSTCFSSWVKFNLASQIVVSKIFILKMIRNNFLAVLIRWWWLLIKSNYYLLILMMIMLWTYKLSHNLVMAGWAPDFSLKYVVTSIGQAFSLLTPVQGI